MGSGVEPGEKERPAVTSPRGARGPAQAIDTRGRLAVQSHEVGFTPPPLTCLWRS